MKPNRKSKAPSMSTLFQRLRCRPHTDGSEVDNTVGGEQVGLRNWFGEDALIRCNAKGVSTCARKAVAYAKIYELCAKRRWPHPTFMCFNDGGLQNKNHFSYVVVVFNEAGRGIVQCLGNYCRCKREAADDAAEIVLWCLGFLGLN